MLRFLLLMVVSLGLGLLFAGAVRRPLARVARAVLLGVVTALTLLGVTVGIAGASNDAWWAAILGAGIIAVALRLAWGLRRRRPIRVSQEHQHVPVTRVVAPEPQWRSFESNLDWVGRQQARRSRRAIEGFVAERDSPSLTHEHRSLLLSCEKRVPELVATCLDRCRNATREESERYVDETLATLVQIGKEAERARREVREADDQRLQVLHRYFDEVAGQGEDRRPPQ